MRFHELQKNVIRSVKYDNPKIMICSGAKRSGKTFVLTFVFLMHIAKFKDMGLSFILGGANQASIRRNILDDMEKILGKELKLNKSNAVEIFGNKIYCFDGANADSYKKMRGFTSAGAFLNEATTLHDTFVKEAISRCSHEGARIYMDTNPENPSHTVKVDYVDKDGQRLSNGQLNIKAFNFTLYDNTFLNKEYVESIEASTPSGMFFDRDILGIWVASEGVVYKDFDRNKHYITKEQMENVDIVKYVGGIDYGWEHHGSIVIVGIDKDNKFYLVKEIARQHKYIDWWIEEAKSLIEEYGNITFHADYARPEHIDAMRAKGIRVVNAKKDVLAGISEVASLFKQDRLFVVEDEVDLFKNEIYNYVWKTGKDEPVKTNDDVLDALRYAIYSEKKKGKKFDRNKYGL